MNRFPVVLFVYKRPRHTRRTLAALAACHGAELTDVVIYADGPKSKDDVAAVDEVRQVCAQARGFRTVSVVASPTNHGLAASVISGVTRVLAGSGACIVVEDDLELAPGFLEFMNGALGAYAHQPRVFSLSGYAPPPSRVKVDPTVGVWFAPRTSSWGWATWKDRWDRIDWDVVDREAFFRDRKLRRRFNRGGRDLSYFMRLQLAGHLDSWAVRMAWTQSLLGGLTAYPARSFVANGGLDGSGTHSVAQKSQDLRLSDARVPEAWPPVVEAPDSVLRQFRRHYEGTWWERWGHRLRKFRRMIEKFRD